MSYRRRRSDDRAAIRQRLLAVAAMGLCARRKHRRGGRSRDARKATAVGDGFAGGFPTEPLSALLQAKRGRPQLSKADWVALGQSPACKSPHETKCMWQQLTTRRDPKYALLCM
jgi:hypothetical protein